MGRVMIKLYVDRVRREAPQVTNGITDLDVESPGTARGHEPGIRVHARRRHAGVAEQREPLTTSAAEVHDAAGAHQPAYVRKVAGELRADLGGRAAKAICEGGVDRRETRSRPLGATHGVARPQFTELGFERAHALLGLSSQAMRVGYLVDEPAHPRFEVEVARLCRRRVALRRR